MASPNSALRILVLGDFSGRATGKLTRVDRDNFNTVLREFAPSLELAGIDLTFASLNDFEPDSIYRRSELFAPLRRRGQQLYSEPCEGELHKTLKPSAEQIERLTSPGGLLDAVVEKGPAPGEEFQSMVERIVAPYALPADNPETRRASAERAQRINLLMSHILHDERFQALESAWRGLHLLLRNLETDRAVHLHVLDISKERLAADLPGAGRPWNLLIGNFSFDRAVLADVQLLEQISLLAQSLDAPFIAEWLPSQQENAKAEMTWQALRKSPAAGYAALALPRFLLRPPYGKKTAPVEEFDFEEMPGDPVHAHYLWGNPAFACGLALASNAARLGGMPLPTTEVLLSERDCQSLVEQGALPVAAVAGSDEIAFPRLQSIGFQSLSW